MEHEKKNPKRPSVKVEDSKWTEYFIDLRHLPCSHQPETTIKERRDELVRKVGCMIQEYTSRKAGYLLKGMKTVDDLERLGVGYHFEQEIAMFMDLLNSTPVRDGDLCAIALRFRLLRQHRYDVPCEEVLESFKDENGNFKDALRCDVDVLLSLYEAAHLLKCDEDVLNSAIIFTTDCLSSLVKGGQLPKPILQKVQDALASPTYRRMQRLEARLYMPIYESDKDSNQEILELAKLDFHILQLMHRDEVKRISLWYKDLNPGSTLGQYIRERPVECYFWALGVFYEPQYAKARMMFAKLIKMFSLLDDTFDSYGTMDELPEFNQAVQRWDIEGAKQVGKCYGYVMSHLSKTLEEFVADGASPFGIECIKEIMKEVAMCMLQEVIWREQGHVPPVRDHLKVSLVTTMYWPLACISFVGMDAGDDVYTWARSLPKIIENAAVISRLRDDVSGYECEKERSKVATAVDCYVKEHKVTVQQAKEALLCVVEEQWRSINQEFLSKTSMIPAAVLMRVVNLARVMESLYKKQDGYTHTAEAAVPIHKLLNESVYQ